MQKRHGQKIRDDEADTEEDPDDIWSHSPLELEAKRQKKRHAEKLAKAKKVAGGENLAGMKVSNATEFEKSAPKGYSEHITFKDPGMSFEEMHKYDVAEAARKGVEWHKKAQHRDLTYPMNKTAKVYNFPDSQEAIAAAKKLNASGAGDNFMAVFDNQGKLEQMMRIDDFMAKSSAKKIVPTDGTYRSHDSFSWIEPYYPRQHAYTWP
jgi:hypothetical protein